MINNLKIKGRVKITVKDLDGDSYITERDNLVVNAGLDNIAELLTGAGYAITDIEFGTSATAATATDTTITGAFSKVIDSDSVSSPGKAVFLASLTTAENNGMTIREIGLIDSNGDLFARIVIPAIVKTNLITVSVEWTINISA
jgi:hypothetical protein